MKTVTAAFETAALAVTGVRRSRPFPEPVVEEDQAVEPRGLLARAREMRLRRVLDVGGIEQLGERAVLRSQQLEIAAEPAPERHRKPGLGPVEDRARQPALKRGAEHLLRPPPVGEASRWNPPRDLEDAAVQVDRPDLERNRHARPV